MALVGALDMTKRVRIFCCPAPVRRSKSCDRALPHERAAWRGIEGFSRFCPSIARAGSNSTVGENGINKKHLRRLISVVNLGKLFSVFLQQV
jgi:hypothetical protein